MTMTRCHRCCKVEATRECTERQSTWSAICEACFDKMGNEQYLYVPPDGRMIIPAFDEVNDEPLSAERLMAARLYDALQDACAIIEFGHSEQHDIPAMLARWRALPCP